MSNKLKEPNKNCSKCNRLKKFRNENRKKYPSWFNAPVPSIINNNAELLIVGLAPGISGANRTGRPFTGDHAGLILFGTLKKFGFSDGLYKEDGFDSLKLENCSITNAVRCVPPKNLPNTSEIKNCESFLQKTIIAHKNLKLIIALGLISHKSIISSFGFKPISYNPIKREVYEIKTPSEFGNTIYVKELDQVINLCIEAENVLIHSAFNKVI